MRKPNCECAVCGKKIYIRPNRLLANKNGNTCSRECSAKLRAEFMKGENNHQFGVIGIANSSSKSGDTISNLGYVLEYCPGHPKPHDKSVKGHRVKQHRLVVERNREKFDDEYFEEINGWTVLKDMYDVHHINEIKTDNRLLNLQILTRAEHSKLHNKNKIIKRDSLGRIIGIFKDCELLETPEDINATT